MDTIIFLSLIVLFGSAIFSGMEAAFFSVSLSRAKVLAEQKKSGSKSLVAVKENMNRPITVIVILNNIFTIVGSMVIGVVTTHVLGAVWLGAVSAVLTLFIIVFAEIVPKGIGESYGEHISLFIAAPVLAATRFFLPIIWLIEHITAFITPRRKIISEEEIRILSHLGHLEGSIEKDEQEMIQKVFLLNDLRARDIMTPRVVIMALNGGNVLGDIEDKIYLFSHSRIPIYRTTIDNIIGLCHQRELLTALARDQKHMRVEDFRKEVMFVPEQMRADILLMMFQKQRCHLAIVKDEFGGTAGLVTLEDVLEQLVGEIVDETDVEIDKRESAKASKESQESAKRQFLTLSSLSDDSQKF